MGIETVIMDSGGQKLDSVEDPTNILHRVLPSPDDASFQCLNRIDWYGDTVFNRHQFPVLRDELQRLICVLPVTEHRLLLHRVDSLAARCEAEPHLYLKFVGD